MGISTSFRFLSFVTFLIISCSHNRLVSCQDEAITIDPHWEDNENINDSTVVLQSPRVTNWGRWGRFAHCSMTHSYVTGFQLKVEEKTTRNDNTAVNGINLSCGIPEQKEIERVESAKGPWGTGRTRFFCSNGPAVGFQLKVQKAQGPDVDDVATVNVKMICGNGQILEGFDEQGDYYVDTVWSEAIICPEKMAVCGIQTQVEPRRWLGDDTSLNNIRIKCCPLPLEPPGDHQEQETPTTVAAVPEAVPRNITNGWGIQSNSQSIVSRFKNWLGISV